jgi:hypothetical protein
MGNSSGTSNKLLVLTDFSFAQRPKNIAVRTRVFAQRPKIIAVRTKPFAQRPGIIAVRPKTVVVNAKFFTQPDKCPS